VDIPELLLIPGTAPHDFFITGTAVALEAIAANEAVSSSSRAVLRGAGFPATLDAFQPWAVGRMEVLVATYAVR